ncbi:MAG: site-specific DNA-methyltransferase [Thioploca sp.]|nr:site-specific DNA-methyltransferase [Thioploca sp.]
MKYSTPHLPIAAEPTSPVKCLGLIFENDQLRRAYFVEKLRDQLTNPEFRNQVGFPQATSEAILALSDPPYYTACPNPWLADFLNEEPATPVANYHREPFTADVREGKNDPIYNAHSYHTKVPHKAIMRYILHYTQPGDVVLDGFCGTGMTGVAAQLCGDRRAVEELGYRVLTDGTIESVQADPVGNRIWQPYSRLGTRRVILNDLSPAATFIAYNYNTPLNSIQFEQEAKRLLQIVETECGWMYQTLHACTQEISAHTEEIQAVVLGEQACPAWIQLGRVHYTLWSDVFSCPECTGELIFWQVAVDQTIGQIKTTFSCPHCDALLNKPRLERVWLTQFDKALQQTLKQAKQIPVLIYYSVGNTRFQKTPDIFDLALLDKIAQTETTYWFPTAPLPSGYNTRQPMESHGITHLHHFYTPRNLQTLACFHDKVKRYPRALFILSGIVNRSTKMNRIHLKYFCLGGGGWNAGYLKGTLYVSSLPIETSIIEQIEDRIKSIKNAFSGLSRYSQQVIISASSAHAINIADNSIDYIFLDPPFGSNLMYSELNFLWEGWLQVFTHNSMEAIVNKAQGKDLNDYRRLMAACFQEAFRVLKPGRWITIEFSNTQAKVWNVLQSALQQVGFIIANVSALDKKQGSFKAVTTTTAVRQDLIISAYKPDNQLAAIATTAAQLETGVWEFVRHHLKQVSLTKIKDGTLEFITERDPRILYDRTVAYLMNQGYSIPFSSQTFQIQLREHFLESDGMIFLPEQFESYQQKKQQVKQHSQLELFVCDERSAINWLQHFLTQQPATYQEIHPQFTQLLGAGWKKHEPVLELETLLEINFLKYDGHGPVPEPIQHYLSNQFEACRHLAPDNPNLQQTATERWYVPDPQKNHDLEKIRENHLLREFKHYCQPSVKKLKLFRLEVLRAGFKMAWVQKDYQTIIAVAKKIPEPILYEDEQLLQFYDLAITRTKKQS